MTKFAAHVGNQDRPRRDVCSGVRQLGRTPALELSAGWHVRTNAGERMSKAPRGFVPYCATYHCAGDCGLPHSPDERAQQFTAEGRAQERKRLTLAAFDTLEHPDKRASMDEKARIERNARNSL